MLESAIFGPRIESVEHNAFLPGFDQVFGFGDGLACHPIVAFGFTDHFAEGLFAFAVNGALDATFGHFLINHIAKVNLGEA